MSLVIYSNGVQEIVSKFYENHDIKALLVDSINAYAQGINDTHSSIQFVPSTEYPNIAGKLYIDFLLYDTPDKKQVTQQLMQYSGRNLVPYTMTAEIDVVNAPKQPKDVANYATSPLIAVTVDIIDDYDDMQFIEVGRIKDMDMSLINDSIFHILKENDNKVMGLLK